MKKHDVTAVHCPSSNMKFACGGTLSLPAYTEKGVDVRIGTTVQHPQAMAGKILGEARTAAFVQRHDHWDATLLPAKKYLPDGNQG
ncbi:MAG: hypothetical protein CM15mP47_2240 [Methanobacteriota archaeon]|nr:MAG: hypothetical protein CM15mP47_2240 [Euryarchaeota archaeon]